METPAPIQPKDLIKRFQHLVSFKFFFGFCIFRLGFEKGTPRIQINLLPPFLVSYSFPLNAFLEHHLLLESTFLHVRSGGVHLIIFA